MKKGILCILLSVFLLLPTLVSCQQTSDFSETEASIYTLYTIKDDSTNEEAIKQVELALNRVLFYRLGVILKLEMVNEDEYDKLIEDKFAEIEQYQLDKKNKTQSTSSATSEDGEVSIDVLSGDDVLDILENGGEIPLDEPRLDIFLVRGYDDYYDLATNGKLSALDEKLNNEGKALKSSIHSTLFTAAKVGNKTYGIPVNNAIGEYTYLVFDAEILNQHGIDPNTIVSLEDLQDYLELVKTNNPDVVPLMNTKESTSINFLSNEGFPALVTPSASANDITKAYSNNDFKNYFAMIARYKALGYIGDSMDSENADDNTRYAVRIESGTIDSIEAKLSKTGYEYEYSMFSAPIATNETTIDNIFCISKYVVSSELTDVIEIVTAINTDPQLMNILTYGIENEHYVLNDDGQVERLVSEIEDPNNPGQKIDNKYIMDPNYVGNCFITYTLKGENPEKWNNAIKQNQDAIVSPSLGFTSDPTKFTYKVTTEVEDPKNPGTMIKEEVEYDIYEPDYIEVINSVVDKYYPALLAGTAVEFDYEALRTQATDEITTEFIERNDELFEENVLKPMFAERMRDEILKKQGASIYKEVEEEVRQEYFDGAKKSLKNKLTSQFKSENPDLPSEDITAMVNEVLTDDYVNEHFNDYYTEEEVQETIDSLYEIQLESTIEDAIDEIEDSAEYDREFQKIKNSEEYNTALQQMLDYDAPSKIIARIDEYIAKELTAYTDNMIAEMEVEIENAVKAFIAENAETLNMTETEILVKIEYYVEEQAEEGADEGATEGESEGEDEEVEKNYVAAYETWFDFVFEEKLKQVYYTIFGNPATAA